MQLARHTVDAVMAEERAASFTKRSIKTEAKRQGLRLALSMLDLTTLEGADSPEKVRAICRKAIDPLPSVRPPLPSSAAVCVYPSQVAVARQALAGTPVRVASVATAFPSGQFPLDVRVADTQRALEAGADEIDMVINRGAFLSGRFDVVADEIRQIRRLCAGRRGKAAPDRGGRAARLKIILETGELETYDAVRRASDLAIEAAVGVPGSGEIDDGEVFIKTSTGKVTPAATMPVTLVMMEAIRDHFLATGLRIGIKPAGGIRRAKQALHYLVMAKETLGDAWLTPDLFRFGASTLADDLIRQLLANAGGRYAAGYDVAQV